MADAIDGAEGAPDEEIGSAGQAAPAGAMTAPPAAEAAAASAKARGTAGRGKPGKGKGKGKGKAAPRARRPVAKVDTAAVRWDEVRVLFEQGMIPLFVVAKEAGVSEWAIRDRAKKHGWARPPVRARAAAGEKRDARLAVPPNRRVLVGRLFAAFERQVAEIEARLADDGEGPGEGEVRMLAALAKTLETLIGLDKAARAEDPDGGEKVDGDALRQEIARRLDRLAGR